MYKTEIRYNLGHTFYNYLEESLTKYKFREIYFCSYLFTQRLFNNNKDKAIMSIPIIEIKSGFSFGIMSQPKIAPNTGIINFQTFKSDTFTPGLFSKTNHKVIAVAERKLSHPRER